MNIRLIAVSLLTGLAASPSLAGQSPDEDAAALRREAVLRVESVTERLTRFEDRRLAVYSLARLGGSVCRFDATAAETVFQAGVVLLAHDSNPGEPAEGRLEPWRLLEPGRFLVRRADDCDSAVGKRIAENLGGLPTGMIEAARESMSEGPRRAAELVAPLLADLPELSHGERMQELILFGEAAETLAAGGHESALGVAARLPAGLKRALLYYGAASLRLKAGDRESGFPLLLAALQDAAGVAPGDRARVLLQVAKSMAPVEREFALAVLSDAIRALNETQGSGTDLRRRGFSEALRTGSYSTDVRLSIPGLEKTGLLVAENLPAFTHGDLDRLEAVVEELRDEPQLAGVLVILAESRIARAYRYSPAAATSKVRLTQ